jgi:hypothetical protein
MGYNLSVGCHDCKVHAWSLRGEEAFLIRWFGAWHGRVVNATQGRHIPVTDRARHRVEVLVDNGFSQPRDEFPREYRDVTDEVAQFADLDRLLESSYFYDVQLGPDGRVRATYDDAEVRYSALGETLTSSLASVVAMVDPHVLVC